MTEAATLTDTVENLQVQVAALQALVRGLIGKQTYGPMRDNSFAAVEMRDLGDLGDLSQHSFVAREDLLQAAKDHALKQWHQGRGLAVSAG